MPDVLRPPGNNRAMATAPYEIDRSAGACAATGAPLVPGDRRVTVLVEDPRAEGLRRLDYAESAWDDGARPQPPMAIFGFWRNTVPQPGGTPDPLLGTDDLLDLFEQLEDAESPERLAFRYVLALMLIRKRRLVHEGALPAEADQPARLLVRPKDAAPPPERGGDGPPLVEVAEPTLDAEALDAVTAQLSEVMKLDA